MWFRYSADTEQLLLHHVKAMCVSALALQTLHVFPLTLPPHEMLLVLMHDCSLNSHSLNINGIQGREGH